MSDRWHAWSRFHTPWLGSLRLVISEKDSYIFSSYQRDLEWTPSSSDLRRLVKCEKDSLIFSSCLKLHLSYKLKELGCETPESMRTLLDEIGFLKTLRNGSLRTSFSSSRRRSVADERGNQTPQCVSKSSHNSSTLEWSFSAQLTNDQR